MDEKGNPSAGAVLLGVTFVLVMLFFAAVSQIYRVSAASAGADCDKWLGEAREEEAVGDVWYGFAEQVKKSRILDLIAHRASLASMHYNKALLHYQRYSFCLQGK